MNINDYIDHTYLKPTTTQNDIQKICSEAKEYNFKAICIPSSFLELAKKELLGSKVKLCTVIGFPLGYNSTDSKVAEAELAIRAGADEVDMVINIGKLKNKQFDYLLNEIKKIKAAIQGKTLKVIVETALLDQGELQEITKIVVESGADFIKTSTGFSTRGASLEDVQIMKQFSQGKIEIKASGGIRDLTTAEEMIKAGATRLGTSSGVAIVQGKMGSSSY